MRPRDTAFLYAPVWSLNEIHRRTLRYRESGMVRGTLQPYGRDGSGERFLFHLPPHSNLERDWVIEIGGRGFRVESAQHWPQHSCLTLRPVPEGEWR